MIDLIGSWIHSVFQIHCISDLKEMSTSIFSVKWNITLGMEQEIKEVGVCEENKSFK